MLNWNESRLLDGDLRIRLNERLASSHLELSERIEGALALKVTRIGTKRFLQPLSRKWIKKFTYLSEG